MTPFYWELLHLFLLTACCGQLVTDDWTRVEHMIQIGHFNSFLRDLETGVRWSNSAPLEWASSIMYPENQRQLTWRWRESCWIKEYRVGLLALMPGGSPGSLFSLWAGQLSLSSLRFSHILPINLLYYWNSFSYFQPKQLSQEIGCAHTLSISVMCLAPSCDVKVQAHVPSELFNECEREATGFRNSYVWK